MAHIVSYFIYGFDAIHNDDILLSVGLNNNLFSLQPHSICGLCALTDLFNLFHDCLVEQLLLYKLPLRYDMKIYFSLNIN